ncbi:MAG: DUF6456 domain-containing protein [Alphaproteobacteria bacterium]
MSSADNNGKIVEMDEVLRRLGEARAMGRGMAEDRFGVFVARNRFARPVMTVGPEILRLLMAGELISRRQEQPDEWVISRLGRARLRRTQANDAPFRSQHQVLDLREQRGMRGEPVVVRVNNAESPLGWLISHKDRKGKPLISTEQFAAGERLREDFTLANLAPRVTAMWGMPINHAGRGGGGGGDPACMNDTMIAAKDRLWAALDAVGPDLGGVLLQVCCHLNGLTQTERNLGWPARAGKVVLGIALDRLAAHYGIGIGGPPRQQPRTYHSGVADTGCKK